MRSYTPNSPEAAARVVTMALLADGHLSMTEVQAIDRLKVSRKLGLEPSQFTAVLEGFCNDLVVSHRGPWTGSSQLDAHIRAQLMSEITHPHLQTEVMALCADIVQADGHLADDEVHMLDMLAGAWPTRFGPGTLAAKVPTAVPAAAHC